MAYMISGKDIRDIAEIAATTDSRAGTYSGFSTTSTHKWNGNTYEIDSGNRFLYIDSSYWYAEFIDMKYQKGGSSTYWKICKRGTRPNYKFRMQSHTSIYINKFSDGEVWAATSDNSRSGTQISTAAENINYLSFIMCGAGGGGGGSSGSSSGGGGGGGAYCYSFVKLNSSWKHYFEIGAAGTAGASNSNGGTGGHSQAITYTNKSNTVGNHHLICYGGSGGSSGGNGGGGGSGGFVSGSNDNSYFYTHKTVSGSSGGAKNNGGGYCTTNFNNYSPEAQQITYLTGGGGASGYGGGGGTCPIGNGGAGAGSFEDGKVGEGRGAGGGGGAYVWFSSRLGGAGTSGSTSIYY